MAKKARRTRAITIIINLFIALGAFYGGTELVADPSGNRLGMNLDLLNTDTFPDFLIPGLLLIFIFGFGNLTAAAVTFSKNQLAPWAGLFTGTSLIAWVIIQLLIIGFRTPVQPVFLMIGLVQIYLGCRLGTIMAVNLPCSVSPEHKITKNKAV